MAPYSLVIHTDSHIPPVWDIISDHFEGGNLDAWVIVSPSDLSLTRGDGRNGSTGLSVAVPQHESYLYQTVVASE